jgi:hypothetical protein
MATLTGKASWTAVGGFSCLERLELALAGLIAAAIGLHRMVLICASRRLEEIAASRTPAELSHVRELIQDPSRVGVLESGFGMAPESAVLADLDLRAETSASGLFHGFDDSDEHAPALLLVSGWEPEELLQATRVLLAHSNLSVRTREHVRPPPSLSD